MRTTGLPHIVPGLLIAPDNSVTAVPELAAPLPESPMLSCPPIRGISIRPTGPRGPLAPLHLQCKLL
jgi:hypothetical protein